MSRKTWLAVADAACHRVRRKGTTSGEMTRPKPTTAVATMTRAHANGAASRRRPALAHVPAPAATKASAFNTSTTGLRAHAAAMPGCTIGATTDVATASAKAAGTARRIALVAKVLRAPVP